MLLVFGSITVDEIFPLARLPRPGETVRSREARSQSGGKGANQAVAAARDGARVMLVGAVGDDALAETARAGPREAGVDLQRVATRGSRTGRSAIFVDPAGYTMVATDPGANDLARADQVSDALLGPASTLLLQMETDARENAVLIRRARERGARVILDLSPMRMIDTSALRTSDILIGSSTELAWIGEHIGTGNNPASIHAALGVTTIRMMGVQGAEIASDQGYLRMPAFAVTMRDTTGAGDCFTGVLAGAVARGASLVDAVRRAAVAAALSTTLLGAQASMPAADDIDRALLQAPEAITQEPEIQD